MTKTTALAIFTAFIREKEDEVGIALAEAPGSRQRLSKGWAFYYQSLACLTDGMLSNLLDGQGPIVVADDGQLFEGGSLDVDAAALLTTGRTFVTRAREGS